MKQRRSSLDFSKRKKKFPFYFFFLFFLAPVNVHRIQVHFCLVRKDEGCDLMAIIQLANFRFREALGHQIRFTTSYTVISFFFLVGISYFIR